MPRLARRTSFAMARPVLAGFLTLLLLASACGDDDGPQVTQAPTSPATAGASTPSAGFSPTAALSPTAVSSPSPSPSPSPARGGTYVVQAGDTLFDLATAWGVTVTAIVEANALADPDTLAIGQELKIP